MAIRKVRELEDDILRKSSKEVEVIDDKIKELLKDMLETMYEHEGLGLAAVQVGILKRVIVIDIYDNNGAHIFINPVIVKTKGKQTVEEGCLSIPNRYANVERPAEITVKALNENGEKIEIVAKEMMAVALCHEIDHLNGGLFIDKMIPGTLEYGKPDRSDMKGKK